MMMIHFLHFQMLALLSSQSLQQEAATNDNMAARAMAMATVARINNRRKQCNLVVMVMVVVVVVVTLAGCCFHTCCLQEQGCWAGLNLIKCGCCMLFCGCQCS